MTELERLTFELGPGWHHAGSRAAWLPLNQTWGSFHFHTRATGPDSWQAAINGLMLFEGQSESQVLGFAEARLQQRFPNPKTRVKDKIA